SATTGERPTTTRGVAFSPDRRHFHVKRLLLNDLCRGSLGGFQVNPDAVLERRNDPACRFGSADGARAQRTCRRLHDWSGLQAAARARRQSLDGGRQGVGRYGTTRVSRLVVGL